MVFSNHSFQFLQFFSFSGLQSWLQHLWNSLLHLPDQSLFSVQFLNVRNEFEVLSSIWICNVSSNSYIYFTHVVNTDNTNGSYVEIVIFSDVWLAGLFEKPCWNFVSKEIYIINNTNKDQDHLCTRFRFSFQFRLLGLMCLLTWYIGFSDFPFLSSLVCIWSQSFSR